MKKERIALYRDICILSLFATAVMIAVGKYIVPALLPFVIAWGVAMMMRRPADFIAERTRIKRNIVRPTLSVLIIVALIGGVVFGIVRLATETWYLFSSLSESGAVGKFISYFTAPVERLFEKFGVDPELQAKITDTVLGAASGVISGAANVVTAVVGAVPGILLFVLVTVISVVYFAIDLENVNERLLSLLPKRFRGTVISFKERFFKILIKYVRSYALIMLITFLLMLAGLMMLGVSYAVLMAFVIAVLDLLPVLGIGIVLIPWGIYCLTVGSSLKLGIGLLILWGVGTVVRQAIEPKIVGKELGMHPLLTLVLMYAGYSLFGFFGLVLLPFSSVFISIIPPRSRSESDEGSSDTAP